VIRLSRHRAVGEDVGVRHVLGLLVIAAVGAGCGDNLTDPYGPFVGLVRVSGDSPFLDDCAASTPGGRTILGMEVEPSIAIDPTSATHLIGAWQQDRWSTGGANGIGTAVSFDGGATWTPATPHLGRCAGGDASNGADYERATDPWVAFAADGTAFLAALVFDATTARNAVVASRSTDGGLTWNDPTVLRADDDPSVFNDKDAMTADPTDPGRVYVVWDRLTGQTEPNNPAATGPTWFARTTDGAWEPARAIFDPGVGAQTIGNVIAVLPDGTLVNVFDLITQPSGTALPINTLAVIRSTDKGQTWSDAIKIAQMHTVGVADPNNNVFIRSGTILPEIAVDRVTGALYLAWQDAPPGTVIDRIAVVSSLDGGLTWSPPMYASGDPEAAAFTPMIAVAGDGTVGVTYYDLRGGSPADGSAFRISPWLATSRDGGRTWIDDALSDPFDLRPARLFEAYFLGDYQGLVATESGFIPFFSAATAAAGDNTDIFVRAR
jgi:hypothetical protein